MAKTKSKSAEVETLADKEQAEVTAPNNNASLKFSDFKDKNVDVETNKEANANVAEVKVDIIPKRMEFNPKNLRR